MASFHNGLLGDLNGKIGPITLYKRYDNTVGRIGTSQVTFKKTERRLVQQQKMRVVTRFTKAFTGTGFLEASFPAYGGKGSGLNRMTSLLLNQAVEGSYPNIYLNYAQVLVSKGKLPGAVDAAAEVVREVAVVRVPTHHDDAASLSTPTKHILQVHFANNSQTGTASPQDRVILVAYCEALGQAMFSLDAGRRGEGQASLDVTALQGQTVETWIGFLNPDGSNVADSVYLGRVHIGLEG